MSTNTISASSLVFTDGFDYYNSILEKWTGVSQAPPIFEVPGRFGYGQCISPQNYGGHTGGYIYVALGTISRIVVGTAFNYNNSVIDGGRPIFGFIDNNANYIYTIGVDPLGRINFCGVSSAPNLIPVTGWNYLEIDMILAPSGSSTTNVFQININGKQVLTGDVTPISSGTPTPTAIQGIALGADTGGYFDDIYVLGPTTDTLGDSFLGDVKVVPLIPNGDGSINQWTQTGGVSGQNYSSIDDVPADGDNSYVSSNTPGQLDMYTTPSINSLTPVSAVYGVSVYALGRKDDSPARFLSAGVGNGSTESFDAGSAVGSTYSYVRRVLPVNPFTNEPWQIDDFENLQLGIKIIS